MATYEWSDLLGRLLPSIPVSLALVISGIITVLAGGGLAKIYAGLTGYRSNGPSSKGGVSRDFGRIVSGPTASLVGSVLGLVVAGPLGQFLGNPTCALGFGVGQQSFSGDRSARDWGQWRSVFIAGWIGSWVGELTTQFAFTALPSGLRLSITLPVTSTPVPVAEMAGYLVGLGTALIARAGGRRVAIGSDVDTALAGTVAGVTWVVIVAGLAFLVLPLGDLIGLGGLLLGPRVHLNSAVSPWTIPVLFGAVTSMLAGTLVLPRVASTRTQHASMRLQRDAAQRLAGVDYHARLTSMSLPGAFTGFVLTMVFVYAFVAGTGARVGSWVTLGEILLGGTALGAVLATAITARAGMDKAQREIIDAATRDPTAPVDPILMTPALNQVIGELLFGATAGLSLAGTSYALVLLWLGRISWFYLAAGLVLGAVLTVVLVEVFRRVQRAHAPGY